MASTQSLVFSFLNEDANLMPRELLAKVQAHGKNPAITSVRVYRSNWLSGKGRDVQPATDDTCPPGSRKLARQVEKSNQLLQRDIPTLMSINACEEARVTFDSDAHFVAFVNLRYAA